MENKKRKYFFKNINVLIAYLKENLDPFTDLKLQKSLYFLWAYYSAMYGDNDMDEYPSELFKANFEAWKYGPVIKDVYKCYKQGDYDNLVNSFSPKNSMERDVKQFIDEMIKQFNDISVFGLVNRSHADHAWRDVYKEGSSHISMSNDAITQEYKEYLKKQGEI